MIGIWPENRHNSLTTDTPFNPTYYSQQQQTHQVPGTPRNVSGVEQYAAANQQLQYGKQQLQATPTNAKLVSLTRLICWRILTLSFYGIKVTDFYCISYNHRVSTCEVFVSEAYSGKDDQLI